MTYGTNDFLARAYEAALAEAPGKHDKAARRARLNAGLGVERLNRWFDGFEPVFTEKKRADMGGYTQIEYDYEALPGLVAPLYVLEPKKSKDTVVYVGGHGGAADALAVDMIAYHHGLPAQLALAGFTVYAPEMIGMGDCVVEGYGEPSAAGCFGNAAQLLMCGVSIAGARVKQIAAVCKFAGTPALYGVSAGGLTAAYAVAGGEARVSALCVSGCACDFADSLLTRRHCLDAYAPGLLTAGEFSDILKLAADRPLLVMNGEDDPLFTADAVEEAFDRLGGMAALCLFDGGHEARAPEFIEWLELIGKESAE